MWNIGEAQNPTPDSSNRWNARMHVRACADMLLWESTAPLGRPVVPEVYMIRAGVSSGTSTAGCGSPVSATRSS